jgi:hypothetical protein
MAVSFIAPSPACRMTPVGKLTSTLLSFKIVHQTNTFYITGKQLAYLKSADGLLVQWFKGNSIKAKHRLMRKAG